MHVVCLCGRFGGRKCGGGVVGLSQQSQKSQSVGGITSQRKIRTFGRGMCGCCPPQSEDDSVLIGPGQKCPTCKGKWKERVVCFYEFFCVLRIFLLYFWLTGGGMSS